MKPKAWKIVGFFFIFLGLAATIALVGGIRQDAYSFRHALWVAGMDIVFWMIGLYLIVGMPDGEGEEQAGGLEPYQLGGIVCKIVGVLFIFSAVTLSALFIGGRAGEGPSCMIAALACAVIGIPMVLHKTRTPEERAERNAGREAEAAERAARQAEIMAGIKEQKEIKSRTVAAEHTAGLPLGQGISCSVRFDESEIVIESSGVRFKIAYEKATEMQVKTSREIKKYYVSDAGGAVAGNAALGPLGALLAGGVQEKTDKIVREYLIITYVSEGRVSYAAFLIPRKEERMKAEKLVREYRLKMSGEVVSFDL